MSNQIADRVKRIKPSATLAVTAKAAELRAQGKDIISLGAGEPDFHTPDHVKHAAILAIENNQSYYTPVDGTPELKEAIIEKLQRDNGLSYSADEVIASCGAKHSIYNLMQAMLNSGDEVVIPAPYWVSYPDMAKLCGAEPVIVNCADNPGMRITPRQLETAITDRTRLVILNSPSNPTGMAYTQAELEALAEVLRKHPQLSIMSDEIYELMYWGDEPLKNLLQIAPDLRDRYFLINGVSKAYAMTGWRIGFAAGPADVIKQMKKVQSQSTSNPSSIAQAAAAAALAGDQSAIEPMKKAFAERQAFLVDALNKLDGVTFTPGTGAFYAFVDFRGVIKRLGMKDDIEFCAHLLETAGVAMVPGSAFGAAGHARISYATSMDALQQAMQRLNEALA